MGYEVHENSYINIFIKNNDILGMLVLITWQKDCLKL